MIESAKTKKRASGKYTMENETIKKRTERILRAATNLVQTRRHTMRGLEGLNIVTLEHRKETGDMIAA